MTDSVVVFQTREAEINDFIYIFAGSRPEVKSACMYKTIVVVCLMTALSLSGIAQPMPLPPMEEIRADMKKSHTDTGRADAMLNLALSYVFRPGEYKSDLDSARICTKQAEEINRQKQDKRIEAKTFFVYSNILRE